MSHLPRTVRFGLLISLALILNSCSKDEEGTNEETVTDADGNVYKTIKIGTQVWMAENLKVTKYRNGDPIQHVANETAWGELTTGAYCNFENNAANANKFGRLYNWYAVKDPRNLAPEGWHLPTKEEWETLITFLGGEDEAGEKMREQGTAHWCSPNVATNESGFTGLPGGVRGQHGYFIGECGWAAWWTATEHDSEEAYNIFLFESNSIPQVSQVSNLKQSGMSIRCIKD